MTRAAKWLVVPAVCTLMAMALPAKGAEEGETKPTYDKGTVQRVDAANKSIVVRTGKTEKSDKTLWLTPEAKVLALDGKTEIRLSDIKVGDTVNIAYRKDKDGNLKAHRVALSEPKAEKSKD
jgi:hypothetical protein